MDPELATIIERWPDLSEAAKRWLVAIAREEADPRTR